MDALARFMAKVDRNGPVVVESLGPCWLWTAGLYAGEWGGYGQFWYDGRGRHAHRWLFEHERGPVPAGLVLDHLCRVRGCVRPSHLEVVTNAENLLRGVGVCAQNARKTHCKRGHEFTVENTIRSGPEGKWRACKECGRVASREHQRRKRSRLSGQRSP